MIEESGCFSVRTLAKYLQIHEMTLYRLLKSRRKKDPLKIREHGLKVGGQWRFQKHVVDARIDSLCMAGLTLC